MTTAEGLCSLRSTMTTSDETISRLRKRLKRKEQDLALLRKRIAALESGNGGSVGFGVKDISTRYMNAVSEGEEKENTKTSAPVIPVSSVKVSSLLSKWNAGEIGGVIEKKETSFARGDVKAAHRTFSKRDGKGITVKKLGVKEAEEVLIEDDEGIPTWAKNQAKKVIRKENPRSVIRGVDVGKLQDDILDAEMRNMEQKTIREGEKSKGNVSSAIAKWGKVAEQGTGEKEEKAPQAPQITKITDQANDKAQKPQVESASVKDSALKDDSGAVSSESSPKKASVPLSPNEPADPAELVRYLEEKISIADREIAESEEKIRQLERSL